jgi:hypothetical protein
MRTRFKLLVHESTGQKYEDLFVKIMSYADPNFKPVKAHGNIGDRGNDGWSSVSGKYYQCYAPENLPANTEVAQQKMKDDFAKLKNYWESISPVKEFVFVVNDKFLGVSPHITTVLNEIKNDHSLTNAEVWGANNIERILFSLKDDQIHQVLGAFSQSGNSASKNEFYDFLMNKVTEYLHLTDWMRISDNLIANSIEDYLIDSFGNFTGMVFRTVFPNTHPELDDAIRQLSDRVQALIDHFTDSNYAYLLENGQWWQIDRRWKREWLEQAVYQQKYDECDKWRKRLFDIHCNLVVALNLYSDEVRKSIKSDYFMNQRFVVNDSLGVYNQLIGYQYVPTEYCEIN